MIVVVWVKDPVQRTNIMTDLVFSQRHTVYKADTEKQVTRAVIDHNADGVVVDSQKKMDYLKQAILFQGQIIMSPPGSTDKATGVDESVVRGINRVGRWFHDYGFRKLHLGVAGVAVRLWLETMDVHVKKPVVFVQLYTQRVGHLAYNTATLITAMKQMNPDLRFIPVLNGGNHADPYLLELFCRWFGSQPKAWHRLLRLPIIRKSRFYLDSWQFTDALQPIQRWGSEYNLSFNTTVDECELAANKLNPLGIDLASGMNSQDYMVFHVRDSAYLDTHQPGNNWQYHNFRDADLNSYLKAAMLMKSHEITPVRIGISTNQHIHQDYVAKGVIDYALRDPDPIPDLHLIAHAKFLLASNSGVTQMAQVLHVPVAAVNWAQLELLTTFRKGDLFIPKKVYSLELERLLTLSEILSNGIGRFTKQEQFDQANLTLIDNSPEEICDLADEMNQRLDLEWDAHGDPGIRRKARFHEILDQNGLLCKDTVVNCGYQFLKDNEWMLQ